MFHVDGWLPLATSNGNDADCGQPELGRERVLRLGQVVGHRAGRGGYGAGSRCGLKPRVRYDATAGAGIANRRVVGRVCHLHPPSLWLQRYVQEGRLTLSKVPGEKNVTDLGTKHLDGKRLWMLMAMLGLRSADGRSELSLRAAGEVMA